MDWESFVYGVISVMILLLLMASFGLAHVGSVNGNAVANRAQPSGDYANIPEKCRPQAGYDIESWKEHLGHHAETQECLKYFD